MARLPCPLSFTSFVKTLVLDMLGSAIVVLAVGVAGLGVRLILSDQEPGPSAVLYVQQWPIFLIGYVVMVLSLLGVRAFEAMRRARVI